MCKIKEWMETLTDVVTMTKKEYLLAITTSLLGGIVIGYVFAPRRTKYTMIGSHNGSKNKNNGNEYTDEFYEDWDHMEKLEDWDKEEDAPLSFH
ncbi:hypothetical protein C806_02448 [Lachnospiraceae bacterium 3-1]|nr:hypothetical protein C806_02448 [Lachnospiraceae bacterium 3-1]